MTPDGDVSVYLTKSGYTGENIGEYRQPGSNGLTPTGLRYCINSAALKLRKKQRGRFGFGNCAAI